MLDQDWLLKRKSIYTATSPSLQMRGRKSNRKKQYVIGKLNDGKITDINVEVLNRQLYGADPLEDKTCSRCSYLPICHGGCPIQRIENEFEGRNNDLCTNRKGYINELLKAYLKIKNNSPKG